MKNREVGKRKLRVVGPYTFKCYVGTHHVTAKIISSKGKEYVVSSANLLPVHSKAIMGRVEY